MDPLRLHEATKHSPASVRASARPLDWANQPYPFKDHPELPPIPLPDPAPDPDVSAWRAIAGEREPARELDAPELARLLVWGAGVRRATTFPDGERLSFRTYASAGALYPNELYVACGGIRGLDPGLYQFHPLERALRELREGDPRPFLVRASGGNEAVARARVTLLLSGIPWRTTWKYGPRGYRHLFWDAGMIVANLLALAAAGGHAAEVALGFFDREVDRLLGVDGRREAALALVPVGTSEDLVGAASGPAEPIAHAPPPLSPGEVEHPELVEAHRAGAIEDPDTARAWRRPVGRPVVTTPEACSEPLEPVLRRRGSVRDFAPDPVGADVAAGILERSLSPVPSDWGPPLVRVAVLAHTLEGLEPGAYHFDDAGFRRLGDPRDLRHVGRYLCLEQPLGGDGAATCFLLVDLGRVVEELGPRGYRAAQLEAGIVGGRIYLGTHACGFGATGLTFYDDDVRRFFETVEEPMLVVALGHRRRRRRRLI